MLEVPKPYVLLVALYLGFALTAGSVVHLPLDPPRCLLIDGVGVLIFIIASVADARRSHAAGLEGPGVGLGRYLGWSVLLSLGLGILSGGSQHFPHYAAALLSLGVLLSLLDWLARERTALRAGGCGRRARPRAADPPRARPHRP
jgi:hypothetical protein